MVSVSKLFKNSVLKKGGGKSWEKKDRLLSLQSLGKENLVLHTTRVVSDKTDKQIMRGYVFLKQDWSHGPSLND